MRANKVLFITQEVSPYVPESRLTELGRSLPLAAMARGKEIRALMPKWGNINERRNQLHEVIRLSGMNLTIDKVDHPLIIKVASVVGTRMQMYFIDSEELFSHRLQECDANGVEYEDNAERMVFYARSTLDTVKKLHWLPDVIHCQGWISSLVPMYLKTAYADDPTFRNCRTVYTQCENGLTLSTGERFANMVEFRSANADAFREFGDSLTPKQVEMLAIKYADGVSFHSPAPDAELVEYAKTMGKPVLECDGKEVDKYVDFFDYIWGKDKSEPNK